MTKILVAEQDPSVCTVITCALEFALHADVQYATDGALAAKVIEAERFDLAIIGMFFPKISGLELAERAANRNIPLLLCSGHPDSVAQLKKFDYPYLSKPFNVENLISEYRKILADTAENISRVKASMARLQKTAAGLEAEIARSRRLVSESTKLYQPRRPR